MSYMLGVPKWGYWDGIQAILRMDVGFDTGTLLGPLLKF